MKKTKLTVVGISPSGGGAETFAATLLSHLSRESFDLAHCVLRDDGARPFPSDVEVFDLRKYRARDLAAAIWRLRQIIIRTEPDVVLCTLAYSGLIAALALAGLRRRPRLVVRIGDSPSRNRDESRLRLLYSLAYRGVDAFICNSAGLASELEEVYRHARGRTSFIHNPTDSERIERMSNQAPFPSLDFEGRPIILFVGRLARQKRLDILLETFRLVIKDVDAQLVVCGDGPESDWLRGAVAQSNLDRRVTLVGFCANPYAQMKQARVLILTSDHEGLPNVLIEAQALGIPAVATRCKHGPNEIIRDGKTGYLAPVGDSRALAESLKRILTEHPLRARMASEARRHALAKFSVSRLIGEWGNDLSEAARAQ